MRGTRVSEETVQATKAALTSAFRALRKQGYVCRQNFLCCGGCASSALDDVFTKRGVPVDSPLRKAVYYHSQDAADLREEGWTYLGWAGDGAVIVAALEGAGLRVKWDGRPETRILVEGLAPVAAPPPLVCSRPTCGAVNPTRRWEGQPVCVACHRAALREAFPEAVRKVLAEPGVAEALAEMARDGAL